VLLTRLDLTNFKNYSEQTIIPASDITFFYGLNGMGKTNLLDAIYYLCTTKSKFGLSDKSLIYEGQPFFRISGIFDREKIIAKYGDEVKKTFEKDKIPYTKLSDHIGYLPVVFFAPDDTSILLGGSEERRKFLDQTISQLDQRYLHNLILTEKILKQRNSFLKTCYETGHYDMGLLDVYDLQLIQPNEYIFNKRAAFVEEFKYELSTISKVITNESDVITMEYRSPLHLNNLIDLLKINRKRDIFLQRTSSGIHKDDLEFTINGFPLKKFASQGQLKSFVVALKLAQYHFMQSRHTKRPILLLDDLFDKLDSQRVQNLIRYLLDQQFGQLFITDTDGSRLKNFSTNNSVFYEVIKGKASLK
jgi:DNA replication and repair protein RecF